MKQMQIIILCPPRVGSTKIRKLISECNIFMGVMKEDKDFRIINRLILKNTGSQVDKLFIRPDHIQFDNLQKLVRLIQNRNQKYRVWGWKDPLTAFTIHLLHPYLSNPYYIVIDRDKTNTIRSMIKRTERRTKNRRFTTISASRFYHDTYKTINRFIREKRYVRISFDRLMNIRTAKKELTRLFRFLHISLDKYLKKCCSLLDLDRGN